MLHTVHLAALSHGITAPQGFRAFGVWSGIKRKRRRDLALVVSERPAVAAATFTTNRLMAAPLHLTRARLRRGSAQAVIVNSGCANCLTPTGLADARAMTRAIAQALRIPEGLVVTASTGIIGRRLPVERMLRHLPQLAAGLSRRGGHAAAEAILTTDRRVKEVAYRCSVAGTTFAVGGMAKGAGMVAPHMATMLCFLTTDLAISAALLRDIVQEAVNRSFNRITIDGDMSTNDLVLCLANGVAGNPTVRTRNALFAAVRAGILRATTALAELMVRDAEGAHRLAAIEVVGAASERDADRCARQVANSLLVKTMLRGADVNVGRIAAAVGASGARFDSRRLEILVGGHSTFDRGAIKIRDRHAIREAMQRTTVPIRIHLHAGRARQRIWTCDLGEGYVRLNAGYAT